MIHHIKGIRAFIYIERGGLRCTVNGGGNAPAKPAQNESVSVTGC